ncbi:MAG: glycosyltransferase family 9 protein [Terriglobia bacterium]
MAPSVLHPAAIVSDGVALDKSQVEYAGFKGQPAPDSTRILVVRIGAIGDTLMTTPAVRALRHQFPGAYLGFLCSPAAYPVLQHNPHLDRVVPLAHWRVPRWLSSARRRALNGLRKDGFSALLVLESDARLLGIVRGAGAKRVIAYGALAEEGGFERAAFNPQQHMIENHLQAAGKLGAQPAGQDMDLGYPPALEAALWEKLSREGIRKAGILAGIHAGWGGRKHSLNETRLRSWPPHRFAEIVRSLVNQMGASMVLTGSARDWPLNQLIVKLAGVPCLNLAGRLSLLEGAALLRRLDVYLTVDSGPAHMAAALGTPLVTLWGPGIFQQTSPRGTRGPIRILNHHVHCAPCYGTPLMKSCRDNICMTEIETREVLGAVQQMLASRRTVGR